MTRPPPLLAFSDECAGLAVSFAVFDFGRQLLVWAAPEGREGASLGSLALGAPAPPPAYCSSSSSSSSSSSLPRRQATATTLLRGGGSSSSSGGGGGIGKEGEEGSVALAKRLAARLGRPVAVAWNLPSLSPSTGGDGDASSSSSSSSSSLPAAAAALGAWAERRLLSELDRAGLLPPKRDNV